MGLTAREVYSTANQQFISSYFLCAWRLWTYPWVLVSTVKLWEGVHAEDYDSRRVIEFTRRRAGGWWNSREHLLREVDGVRKEKEREVKDKKDK